MDTSTLEAFCRQASTASFITVDTEFMRERTYWPQLCLVQVAGPDAAAAIDPLAEGMNLAPLMELLADSRILKVFHAARQDLEIFFHLTGRLPAPVFDTQVAAMVCGFGDSVAYDTLAAKLAKVRIDKSSRFTDWSLRPLSDRQIAYALADVTHLRRIYEKLRDHLARNGRAEWLGEEMAVLTSPSTYDIDPALAYQRIKSRGAKPRMLAVLRELAAWRELEARRRDLPRSRVLRDEPLLEIAHHAPATAKDLSRTRSLGAKFATSSAGTAVLEAVARGLALPDSECPEPQERADHSGDSAPVAELLKVLLKIKCHDEGVAQRLVASSADVDAIAHRGDTADAPALHGWRRHVFGEDALRLRRGELALAIQGNTIRLVECGK